MGSIDTQGGSSFDPNLYVQQGNAQGAGQTQGPQNVQSLTTDSMVSAQGRQTTAGLAATMGGPSLSTPTSADMSQASAWLAAPYMVERMAVSLEMIAQMMLAKRQEDVVANQEMTASKELGDAQAAATLAAGTADAAGHIAQAAASGVSAGAGARNLAKSHAADQAEKREMEGIKGDGISNDQRVRNAYGEDQKLIERLEAKKKRRRG